MKNKKQVTGKARAVGRPPITGEPMRRVLLSLPVAVVEELRREGNGNVSAGLRRRLGIREGT